MPIQPRAPTLRENAGTSMSSRFGLNGLKVPPAISSARNARTSLRNSTHSGGRRIGSKRRAAVMGDLFRSVKPSSENVGRRVAAAEVRSLSPNSGLPELGISSLSKSDKSDFDWERVGGRGDGLT